MSIMDKDIYKCEHCTFSSSSMMVVFGHEKSCTWKNQMPVNNPPPETSRHEEAFRNLFRLANKGHYTIEVRVIENYKMHSSWWEIIDKTTMDNNTLASDFVKEVSRLGNK